MSVHKNDVKKSKEQKQNKKKQCRHIKEKETDAQTNYMKKKKQERK